MSRKNPCTQSLNSPELRQPLDLSDAIELARNVAGKYRLESLEALLSSCAALAETEEITVAVLGRFKAGKSSFLNHLLGRDLLPVGVVPVTAIVTEIAYGPLEVAEVHYLDGRIERVAPEQIRSYVSEAENPENIKRVERLKVDLPELQRLRGLTFVDTPGLESALAHNTEASLEWLPNVGLALVAVSVDPPLSQRDLDLIQKLYAYTPNVSVLVTKADLLSEAERNEVHAFIANQLERRLQRPPRIFLYSVRPGFEHFRADLESALIQATLHNHREHHRKILARKTATLLGECKAYLELAYRSAQTLDSERAALGAQVIGERDALDEQKSELRLITQHAAAAVRTAVMRRLEPFQSEIETRLIADLRSEFPNWARSLSSALDGFESWAERRLSRETAELSERFRQEFVQPLFKVRKQIHRALQSFRDRLSSRCEKAFGVPLQTTELEIAVEEPRTPDIRVGRVFDRSWELLSPVAPMSLLRGIVLRHFEKKIPFMVYANLSRLATQWDESVRAGLRQMEKGAEQRLDRLISTVEHLIGTSATEAPALREDLERVGRAQSLLEE
jgi:GTP-binding protein EngB required for normal cell division